MMRIITGRARGTKLATLAGDNTRPTAERVKEAIFSMIRAEIPDAEVLDLFAGSGQMGLEALSQGAVHAVFCDASREAMAVVRANAEKTHLYDESEFFLGDARTLLRRFKGQKRFDVVFLDPPYALGAIPSCLELLLSCGLLKNGARIVCESAAEADVFGKNDTLCAHFEVLRTTRYGAACVTVLTPKEGSV